MACANIGYTISNASLKQLLNRNLHIMYCTSDETQSTCKNGHKENETHISSLHHPSAALKDSKQRTNTQKLSLLDIRTKKTQDNAQYNTYKK